MPRTPTIAQIRAVFPSRYLLFRYFFFRTVRYRYFAIFSLTVFAIPLFFSRAIRYSAISLLRNRSFIIGFSSGSGNVSTRLS